MKWFKHDCDTSSDPKIKLLKKKHGALGIGVYFEINRLIASNVQSDNVTDWGYIATEYSDNPELLEDEIGCPAKKITEIIGYCITLKLLYKDGNRLLNPKILTRADDYLEKVCKKMNVNLTELYNKLLDKVATNSLQSRDIVPTVSDIRTEEEQIKNRTEEEQIKNNFSSLENITEPVMQEVADKYKVPLPFVKSKYDDMLNWHNENPRKNNKANWKATLMNWVKRDALQIIQTQPVNKLGVTKL